MPSALDALDALDAPCPRCGGSDRLHLAHSPGTDHAGVEMRCGSLLCADRVVESHPCGCGEKISRESAPDC